MKLATVGNGTAIHIYTEDIFPEATASDGTVIPETTFRNSMCGAVEAGGNALYGHMRRSLNVFEGTMEQVTCKRCLKAWNTDAAREARENAAEREALAAGIEAGRALIEDTVEAPAVEPAPVENGTPIQVPARLVEAGDHINGHSVFMTKVHASGDVTLGLCVPYTPTRYSTTVPASALDAVTFTVTERGDRHRPEPRNAALGLPKGSGAYPKEKPLPVAVTVTPKGAKLSEVPFFDRSTKVAFHHPEYPGSVYVSKNPWSSSWFASNMIMQDSPRDTVPLGDYIVAHDYHASRRG